MEDPRRGPRIDPELLRHMKFFGTISLDLASGALLGFAIGRLIDIRFSTMPVWSSVCLILGTCVGFYGVFRIVMHDTKRKR